MYSNNHSNFKQKSGFTLIELLIVIVILGLLTLVATANFVAAQKRSRDNLRKTQVANISTAVETYYARQRQFPGLLPSSTGTPQTHLGCQEKDLAGYYFYYYRPNMSSGCDARNDGINYNKALYKPFPTWIPGLSEFINPMPVDNKATVSSNEGQTAAAVLAATGETDARTYVYYKLSDGYAVFTRLESSEPEDSTIDGSATAYTVKDEPRHPDWAPTKPGITGKQIYMIRK